MPDIRFICDYCGHVWKEYLWGESQIAHERCRGCKHPAREYPYKDVYGYDVKPKEQSISSRDVFGYGANDPTKKR